MSSKKINNTRLKARFVCLGALLMAVVSSCSSGIRDEYLPGNASYNTVPYSIPQAPSQYRREYQQYPPQQPYYYGAPNSRSYYNPYEFQQPYGRNPYSDHDQYYVAPTEYYGNESYGNQQEGKSTRGFSDKQ